MSLWDDPSMKVGGDYVKFEAVGDSVSGTLLSVGAHKWEDGSVSPKLLIDTGDGEKTVTAGQIRLKAALAEQRPEAGDKIKITLTQIEKRQGGKTLKHFDVQVQRGSGSNGGFGGLDPDVVKSMQDKLGATPF